LIGLAEVHAQVLQSDKTCVAQVLPAPDTLMLFGIFEPESAGNLGGKKTIGGLKRRRDRTTRLMLLNGYFADVVAIQL